MTMLGYKRAEGSGGHSVNDTYLLSLTSWDNQNGNSLFDTISKYSAKNFDFNKHDMLIVLMIFFVGDSTPDDGNFHHSHFEKRVPFCHFSYCFCFIFGESNKDKLDFHMG